MWTAFSLALSLCCVLICVGLKKALSSRSGLGNYDRCFFTSSLPYGQFHPASSPAWISPPWLPPWTGSTRLTASPRRVASRCFLAGRRRSQEEWFQADSGVGKGSKSKKTTRLFCLTAAADCTSSWLSWSLWVIREDSHTHTHTQVSISYGCTPLPGPMIECIALTRDFMFSGKNALSEKSNHCRGRDAIEALEREWSCFVS